MIKKLFNLINKYEYVLRDVRSLVEKYYYLGYQDAMKKTFTELTRSKVIDGYEIENVKFDQTGEHNTTFDVYLPKTQSRSNRKKLR